MQDGGGEAVVPDSKALVGHMDICVPLSLCSFLQDGGGEAVVPDESLLDDATKAEIARRSRIIAEVGHTFQVTLSLALSFNKNDIVIALSCTGLLQQVLPPADVSYFF
jgi:hypothetical protein